MSTVNQETFESNFLDWVRTVTIFFIAGLALFSFTRRGKIFAIISFTIAGFLIVASLWDYWNTRSEILKDGGNVKLSLDILAISVVLILFVDLWILYEIMMMDSKTEFTIFAHSQREKEELTAIQTAIESVDSDKGVMAE